MSTSISGASPVSDSSTPPGPGSAISLNEWPLPSTRTFSLPATRARSASTDPGRCSSPAVYVMFPAQLVMVSVVMPDVLRRP